MSAYYRSSVKSFLSSDERSILATLTSQYANDGYVSQYTSATIAWTLTLPALKRELEKLTQASQASSSWQVMLEYPLYRLRRRIDAVVLTPNGVVVIEIKTGATEFVSSDKRQAVEYALDLRDFHAASASLAIFPILWAFEAPEAQTQAHKGNAKGVNSLSLVGQNTLANTLLEVVGNLGFSGFDEAEKEGAAWDNSPYEPVPSVVDAAISLFAGHGVREITVAGSKNLNEAANAVFAIIELARQQSIHAVVFLTGVPGAGKTLAGLNIVHDASQHDLSTTGDIVYLSGNTPLVIVLREALALDLHERNSAGSKKSTLSEARASTRATIQHINDFLKEYVQSSSAAPSGHVIVFDEAQRAWDAQQGKEKFGRSASEPLLVLETMARHTDWSVTVCLIGIGQEINDGEEGVGGWAAAIDQISMTSPDQWKVIGPNAIFSESRSVNTLGKILSGSEETRNDSLHLDVSMRSFRSPELGTWVDELLSGNAKSAGEIKSRLSYPIYLTRNLGEAKSWLKLITRGLRRKGLLASSGARRLRADGVGETLNATDGSSIAHWYLKPVGDIRSSHALEVPANEYTSQGLEIDFACICWGGDLIVEDGQWIPRKLAGNSWNEIRAERNILFVLNSYRVLLTRAREGMIIWVPDGDLEDSTRSPAELDRVYQELLNAGCVELSAQNA
jgi:hypothetical protein